MAFTPKDWRDYPDTTTPLTGTAVKDLETRLSGYTDSAVAAAVIVGSAGTAGEGGVMATAAPYNAPTDGVTDAVTAIQDAIDDMTALGTGAAVFLPGPGTYLISTSLTLKTGVHLILGRGAKLKAKSTFADEPMIIVGAAATDIGVLGGEIDGNKANRAAGAGYAHGLWLAGPDASNRVERVTIEGCYIHDLPDQGVNVNQSRGVRIAGNRISGNGRDGIVCSYSCEGVRIIGNEVSGCGDDGIAVNVQELTAQTFVGEDIVIANNIVRDGTSPFASGIKVRGGQRFTVTGNVVDTMSDGAGIVVAPAWAAPCNDGVVTGNTVTGVSTHGIFVAGYYDGNEAAALARVVVSGNTVRDAGVDGILVYAQGATPTVTDVVVKGNVVDTAGNYGIHAYAGASGVINDLEVDGNTTTNCQYEGVMVGDGSPSITRPRVTWNTAIDCGLGGTGLVGVYVNGAASATIIGNRGFNRDATTPNWIEYGVGANSLTGTCVYMLNEDHGSGSALGGINNSTGATFQTQLGYGHEGVSRLLMRDDTIIQFGSGSPEGAVAAPVGSLYLRTDGSTSTTLYVKTSGTGNTGWTAK